MAVFKPQLKAPSLADPWFIRKESGGYSPCIPGVPLRNPGSTLANCVGWAWGISACREGNVNCDIGCVAGVPWPQGAGSWFNKLNGRKSGMVPKLGAVAVWKTSGSGHVATVEEIYPDGSVLCAESGYNAYIWRTRKYSKTMYKPGYTFLGFIYLKVDFTPTPTKSVKEIAEEVITGKWGNGHERVEKLTAAGYDYDEVQTLVNEILHSKRALAVGDNVKIVGKGAASKDGGSPAYGIGWSRKILKIWPGSKYPYQVGNKTGTTGFYPASSLEK